MKPEIQEQVREANASLRALHVRTLKALNGRDDLTLESIRSLSGPLERMAAIVSQAAELRTNDASVASDLDEYAETLSALHNTLEQARFMLLARQAHLDSARSHVEAVSLWSAALKQTQ